MGSEGAWRPRSIDAQYADLKMNGVVEVEAQQKRKTTHPGAIESVHGCSCGFIYLEMFTTSLLLFAWKVALRGSGTPKRK